MTTTALTVKEVSDRLRLSPTSVFRLIRSGVIPSRRVGVGRGKILVDDSDVAAYWDASKGAERPPGEGQEPIRMASRHLRPPSPAPRPAAKSRPCGGRSGP